LYRQRNTRPEEEGEPYDKLLGRFNVDLVQVLALAARSEIATRRHDLG
jgi:hypothetical protein